MIWVGVIRVSGTSFRSWDCGEGWASEMAILSHPVMGEFLSHCWWNSVLKVVVTGVEILRLPIEAD